MLDLVGARQFIENHFADTTIGCIRLLVDATFRRVLHLVEKISQVRHSVEIVKTFFFRQNVVLENHKKSRPLPRLPPSCKTYKGTLKLFYNRWNVVVLQS